MLCEWHEQLKRFVIPNCVINRCSGSGKFTRLNEYMEEIVRNLKELQDPVKITVFDNFARYVRASNVRYWMIVKKDLRKSMGVRQGSRNHIKRDKSGDVLALVDYLLSDRWTEFVTRRLLSDCTVEIKDLIEVGCERVNDSE